MSSLFDQEVFKMIRKYLTYQKMQTEIFMHTSTPNSPCPILRSGSVWQGTERWMLCIRAALDSSYTKNPYL